MQLCTHVEEDLTEVWCVNCVGKEPSQTPDNVERWNYPFSDCGMVYLKRTV